MSSKSNSMVITETEQPAVKRQCLSLRDACSKILASDTDTAQIPSQLMAALLVEQHSELQSLQMQFKDAVTELNHIKTNSYKVQPLNDGVKPAAKHFDALYERADDLWDVWESIEKSPARSGLVQVPLDTNTISSALALYRVRCLLPAAIIQVGEENEIVWEVCLKSIPDPDAAANVVVLADHDGAFVVWCKHYNADVRELLAVIVDPDCPYSDGHTVAGKVATSQCDRQTLPAATAIATSE
jgi:hypothetical protein